MIGYTIIMSESDTETSDCISYSFHVIDIYVVAIMDITAHDDQYIPLFVKMHCE